VDFSSISYGLFGVEIPQATAQWRKGREEDLLPRITRAG
jgi:hypothetical protein